MSKSRKQQPTVNKSSAVSTPRQPSSVPLDQDVSARVAVTRQSYSFSGPLPPPEVMGLYNELIPNAAERLLAAFEGQQHHRQGLENRIVDSGIKRSWYGLWCGLTVSLAGIGVAALAVVYQQQLAASVIGGGTLVGLVTVFITGRSQQEKERTQRRNALLGDESKAGDQRSIQMPKSQPIPN